MHIGIRCVSTTAHRWTAEDLVKFLEVNGSHLEKTSDDNAEIGSDMLYVSGIVGGIFQSMSDSLSDKIDNLEDELDERDREIGNLEDKVCSLEDKIGTLEAEIEELLQKNQSDR